MDRKEFQLLVRRHLEGKATAQEKAFLERYYSFFENEANISLPKAEFAEVESSIYSNLGDRNNSIGRNRLKKSSWLKIAAIWLLIAGSIGIIYSNRIWFLDRVNPVQQLAKVALKGNVIKISLEDGTQVWLNGGTRLSYPETFRHDTREVWLSGEAYFDVKPHIDKPFIVHTGSLSTQVLGTAFNINGYSKTGNVVVTVTKGKVGVSSDLDANLKSAIILRPNQQVSFHKTSGFLPVKQLDGRKAISWRTGNYSFTNVTLFDVSVAIENRYNIKINIKTEELKKRVVTAGFEANDSLKSVLEALSATVNFNYKFNDPHNLEWY